jgi:hypothetical protein
MSAMTSTEEGETSSDGRELAVRGLYLEGSCDA